MADFGTAGSSTSLIGERTRRFSEALKKNQALNKKALAGLAGQKDLGGEGGLDDVGMRFDLARADNIEERLILFKKKFPEGDLIEAPATKELLFRRNPAEPYEPVEGTEFEPINDVVEFFGGDLGPIAGETAAAVATRGSGSLLTNLFKMFVGGAAGEAGEQGIQAIEGVQTESLTEVGGRALEAGVVSTVGSGVGHAAGAFVDRLRGGSLMGLDEGIPEAMRAAQRLQDNTGVEFPGFTLGQISDSPLFKKMEGQSGAVMPTLGRWYNSENRAARDFLDFLRDPSRVNNVSNSLNRMHREESQALLRHIERDAVNLETGGQAIKDSIERYENLSRGVVDDLYRRARDIDTPEFDISDLQVRSEGILAGNRVPRRIDDDADLDPLVPDEEPGDIVIGAPIHRDLTRVLNQIRSLQPELPPGTTMEGNDFEATDQLRFIQQQLWDLFNFPPGTTTTPKQRGNARIARSLYRDITDVLDNPTNADPNFVSAWTRARTEAAQRFQTLERAIILKSVKEDSPSDVAKRVTQPHKAFELRLLRRVMSSDDYRILQNSFKSELLRNTRTGTSITKQLDKFDDETLNLLLTPTERRLFTDIGRQLDTLNNIGIHKTLERQSRVGAQIRELLLSNQTRRVDELANRAQRDPNLMADLRAGLMESIWNDVQTPTGVDRQALRRIINELRDGGIDRFMTRTDMEILRDLHTIAPFLRVRADSGTALQAGAFVEDVRDVAHGDLKLDLIHTMFEHMGVGRLMTSQPVQRFLLGRLDSNVGTSARETLSWASAVLASAITPGIERKKASTEANKANRPFSERLKAM